MSLRVPPHSQSLSTRFGEPLAPPPPEPWEGAQLSAKARPPSARAKSSISGVDSISASEAAASRAVMAPRWVWSAARSPLTAERECQLKTPLLYDDSSG